MAKLTQKAIFATFEAMLREMPFSKITVSALVKRCQISPNTFYYHYRDIYDLLQQWTSYYLGQYPAESYLTDQWKTVVKTMLRDFQDNREIVAHVLDSIPRDRLERYVLGTLEPAVLRSVELQTQGTQVSRQTQAMIAGAFCYSLTGFLLKFIRSGMQGDVDQEFDPVIQFLDSAIAYYIQQEIANNT